MLVMIFGCWWRNFDVGDIFWMLLPTLMLKHTGRWWQKQPNASLLSQCCRQNISSPTSVTNIDAAKSWRYLYNYFFVHIKYANLYKQICIGKIGEENEFGSRFYHAAFVFSFDVDVPIEFGYFVLLQHGFLQSLKLKMKSFWNHSGWNKSRLNYEKFQNFDFQG